ncbi:hypothetical protein PoB_000193600 [Plakobranchus ocellatus]|uniref:Uncharacterized protein n=1 Tax=Plakobranchus ocellatus TaxID=259542 RepID=A0AAV3XZF1_9GAST|nr:hypothetical protein PoB_000193600 [Plakobranchus ocellatus]
MNRNDIARQRGNNTHTKCNQNNTRNNSRMNRKSFEAAKESPASRTTKGVYKARRHSVVNQMGIKPVGKLQRNKILSISGKVLIESLNPNLRDNRVDFREQKKIMLRSDSDPEDHGKTVTGMEHSNTHQLHGL